MTTKKIFGIILVAMTISFSAPQVFQVHADPTPYIDGIGICTGHGGPGCSAQLLTTNQTGDLLILAVWCHCNSSAPSIIDDTGLAYSLRASYSAVQNPGPGWPLSLWEYYATTSDPLTADNITLVDDTGSYPAGIFLQAFAIQPGGYTDNVFDPSPQVPNMVACPGLDTVNGGYQSCTGSAGSLSSDFAIAITAINDASPCPSPESYGFTRLAGQGSNLDIDYQVLGPQTDVSFTCQGGRAPGTDPIAMVLDAISISSN